MTEYEKIIIKAIKEDKRDYVIFGRIFDAFDVGYFSLTDRILIIKDINDIREKMSKNLPVATGFVRWKTD